MTKWKLPSIRAAANFTGLHASSGVRKESSQSQMASVNDDYIFFFPIHRRHFGTQTMQVRILKPFSYDEFLCTTQNKLTGKKCYIYQSSSWCLRTRLTDQYESCLGRCKLREHPLVAVGSPYSQAVPGLQVQRSQAGSHAVTLAHCKQMLVEFVLIIYF